MTVIFVWLTEPSPRLAAAQVELEESILALGLVPLRYPAGKRLVKLGDVLRRGRSEAVGGSFVWCNSDVILTRNPFDVPDASQVYGFRRREIPDGRHVHGIDLYHLPCRVWDEFLSRDVPPLFIGASFVDWWISRAMEKVGNYETLTGYIDHRSHPKSSPAAQEANPYYQANFRAYNAWARRHGLATIPAPPFLVPGLGHVWGVRDAWRKFTARRRPVGTP